MQICGLLIRSGRRRDIYYAFSGYAKREFLGFAPFFFSLWSPDPLSIST
jgi:hypothetical protein